MSIAPSLEQRASALVQRCVAAAAAPSASRSEVWRCAAEALRAAGLPARPLDADLSRRLDTLAPGVESLTVPAGEDSGGLLVLALPAGVEPGAIVTALGQLAGTARTPSGVLDEAAFRARVDDEIARARRYGRELALLVLRVPSAEAAIPLGELIGPRVRRWDALGALGDDRRELGVLLPETDRGGALGFLNRWRGEMRGSEAGAGIFPADGRSAAELLALARMRLTPVGAGHEGKPARGTLWFRGAPAGLGPETVLCPACLQAYSRGWLRQADRAVPARERSAAEEWLAASCPVHEERIAVPASVAKNELPALVPADAPAMALLARLQNPET